MNYEEWIAKYKPQQNHLVSGAAFDDFMYETYGEEFDYVKSCDNTKIWTLLLEDGGTYLINGLHWVNRLGFFVTEVCSTELDFCMELESEPDPDPMVEAGLACGIPLDRIEGSCLGEYRSLEDYVYSHLSEVYELDKLPGAITCHIDWEGVAHDWSCEVSFESGYVFRSNWLVDREN